MTFQTKSALSMLTMLIALTCAGCASRSALRDDNPIKPVADQYNRNFIVAAPTALGNAVCGAPFFLLSSAADALYRGERSEAYYSGINNFYLVPASACGAVTGAVFVPLSYVCDETPWDFDFHSSRQMGWRCHSH